MKGYHTVELAFLVTPILVEMIKTIADLNDVPSVVSYDDQVKQQRVDPRVIKELIDEMKTKVTNNPETVVDKQSPKGLMSRGEK